MRTRILLPLLAVALLGAACSGDEPAASPSASAGPQSLGPGELPTSSPGAATGTVRSGTAMVTLRGDLSGTIQLLMLGSPALYSPPPGSTALAWTDSQQGLAITGESFTGPRATSDTLTLTLSVHDGAEIVVLPSTAGECTITVDTALERSLSGTFTCTGLKGTEASGATVSADATGTFAASG